MAVMTSRERVLRTVNFQQADRVPIDLGSMKASSIAVRAYNRVKARLGIHTSTRIWDVRAMLACVEDEVMQRFHLDVLPLDISSVVYDQRPDSEWLPKTLYEGAEGLLPPDTSISTDAEGRWVLLDQDRKPTSFRMPRDGYYFDDMSFDKLGTSIDPAAFKPVTEFPDEMLRSLEARARFLSESTDYALLGWGGGVNFVGFSLVTDGANNMTMGLPSEWMVMLLTEKETCHEMMDRSVAASIKRLEQLHDAVGDRCFAWGIATDDSGSQRSEFIRPELWAEMVEPHYAELCAWIHSHTNWKTYFHSCGSIYHLIPYMIEAGIDILNPIQTSAANMQPERLKAEFGGRVVFWGGGCDTQSVLPTASPEQIREHVRERLAIFKPGGGYVFSQVHNIQADIPAESVIAMLDAAYEFS
jgi:uroporphyrinogen decarboxylase